VARKGFSSKHFNLLAVIVLLCREYDVKIILFTLHQPETLLTGLSDSLKEEELCVTNVQGT